jgi:hypothetical protein
MKRKHVAAGAAAKTAAEPDASALRSKRVRLDAAASPTPTLVTSIGLDSVDFPDLRKRQDTFVDKTSAIADLLQSPSGMLRSSRAFFMRPRKFGKSLTLSIAAEMLAAGELPRGVAPWPGYVPVYVEALFGGLAVHERFLSGDPTLGTLLRQAHFVIKLGLGDATTGTKLEGSIMAALSGIAGTAFSPELEAKVMAMPTPGAALGALIRAVPREVPIALLVDEYDAAIIADVCDGQWAAAKAGVAALRSLLVGTKAPDFGSRIQRCIVTGVAKFARVSLFSGANNFADFTAHPLLSAAIGFSEQEIRTVFPAELQRLAASLGTDVDGAIAELARHYNGYCFDGQTTCFNPFAVLKALKHGKLTELELEAASGTNWLGLTPGMTLAELSSKLQDPVNKTALESSTMDIADLEAQRVRVIPLLLQTGLLTFKPAPPDAPTLSCILPNEYARRSVQRMVETAVPAVRISEMVAALHARSPAAFNAAARQLLENVPNTVLKAGSTRESLFQLGIFGAIYCALPYADATVAAEASTQRGKLDISVHFHRAPEAMWIIEIGVAASTSAEAEAAKLKQAQEYAKAYAHPHLLCCVVLVSAKPKPASTGADGAIVTFAWSRRVLRAGDDPVWEPVDATGPRDS